MANDVNHSGDVSGDGSTVLRRGGALIVLSTAAGERPAILYAGPDLPSATPEEMIRLSARVHAPGGPETPIAASWLNCIGAGQPSAPGLLAHRAGQDWAPDPRVKRVEQHDNHKVTITAEDAQCGVTLAHTVNLSRSGVAQFTTALVNTGTGPLTLEWLSAVCLALDNRLCAVMSFTGQWAGEFQALQHSLPRGTFLRENRKGRTSHDSYPGLYCGAPSTSERHGGAAAIHVGASGNHRMRIDRDEHDALSFQGGELLLPGEIILEPDDCYVSAPIYACWSNAGYGDVTHRLHRFVRDDLLKPPQHRPVHFNTWEAVYFDHSPEQLKQLAIQAAALGAERFVLDDGWFGARRNDKAGLGDWFVSEDIYPDGLKPLADHVRSLGMEFGLWFEPEMVNPDSDLYRAHPDWVLRAPGIEPIPSRHQLPLDLTRADVTDYLLERIVTLVRELGIAYIKWDMNRDIQHPGGKDGHAVMHAQAHAVSILINRVRTVCPDLAIESCSSGGARADYSMVERTGRVWPSDNNDARARHAIMRGASHFLPLSVLGNHVGPERCHITGRRFDMAFRAGTAVFGCMGMELDLSQESEADRAILKQAIALHKRHRTLIHSGDYHRLETPSHINGIAVVSQSKDEAFIQLAVLDQHPAPHPPIVHFAGLDRAIRYKLVCIWPEQHAGDLGDFAGAGLLDYGLRMPRTNPDTCLIHHLKALS